MIQPFQGWYMFGALPRRSRCAATPGWMISILSGLSSPPATPALFGPDGGQQGRGEFFVEGEQVFHTLAVRVEFFRAVAEIHGASSSARAWASAVGITSGSLRMKILDS
jgi:hypothetical protein